MTRLLDWIFSNEPIALVQGFFGLGHPLPFRIFSLLGDTWGMIFVVGLALWLFGRRPMYALIGIISLGALAKIVLTDIFDVSRPSGPDIVVYDHLEVGAFPSGHVFEAVGPWGQLFAMGYVRLWVPVLVAVLVGLGRIYLGAHYLADVLAAILFAAIFVWAYARLWPRAQRWIEERPTGVKLGMAGAAMAGTVIVMWTMGGDARRFEVYGMVLAAVPALMLQHRSFPQYRPHASAAARAREVLIGTAGIVAFLLWDRSQPEQALLLGTLTAGLATLWAIWAAPRLSRHVGADHDDRAPQRLRGTAAPHRGRSSAR